MSVQVAQAAPAPLAELHVDAEDDDEYSGDEEDSGEDDDAGSLVDFIVNDEGEEGASADEESEAESEAPATAEEAIKRDLDGIDPSNIVYGRRTRRKTQFLEREIFASADYRKMMLCDVPKEEMHAVESEGEEEDYESEGEDGSYLPTDEEDEEEPEDDDDSSDK